jgi:hypothetical protein
MARGGGLDNPEMGQAAFKLEVQKGGAEPVVLLMSRTKTGSFGHPRPYLARVPAAGG